MLTREARRPRSVVLISSRCGHVRSLGPHVNWVFVGCILVFGLLGRYCLATVLIFPKCSQNVPKMFQIVSNFPKYFHIMSSSFFIHPFVLTASCHHRHRSTSFSFVKSSRCFLFIVLTSPFARCFTPARGPSIEVGPSRRSG